MHGTRICVRIFLPPSRYAARGDVGWLPYEYRAFRRPGLDSIDSRLFPTALQYVLSNGLEDVIGFEILDEAKGDLSEFIFDSGMLLLNSDVLAPAS